MANKNRRQDTISTLLHTHELRATPHISAKDLSKIFLSKDLTITAYENLSFEAFHGEFLCLLGPSGCGKSSTLRALANLDPPTSGTLTINPSPGNNRAKIGMVFQEHALFPWMSLRENIRFPLSNNPDMKNKDINALTDHYISLVGLTKFATLYPHEVSGGMRQRISIARSFAIDPDILLMDEPFVFLDYQTRMDLQLLLLDIWQASSKTIVFVTHDIDEAVLLADRVLVMTAHPGRLKQTLKIEIPRPRDSLKTRKMPLYLDYIDQITQLIREERAILKDQENNPAL